MSAGKEGRKVEGREGKEGRKKQTDIREASPLHLNQVESDGSSGLNSVISSFHMQHRLALTIWKKDKTQSDSRWTSSLESLKNTRSQNCE